MSSKGAKTLIAVLLAAFSGAVIGLFILISLIFLIPTGASNSNVIGISNGNVNSQPVNSMIPSNLSTPTAEEEEPTTEEVEPTPIEGATPSVTPKTTFTPIALPTPVVKPSKTPLKPAQNSDNNKPPKTPPKPSPKKPIPTPSVHT